MEEPLANSKKHPPKLARQIISWLCKEDWVEPILGDLLEEFEEDLEKHSPSRSRLLYWKNAIQFLRPFALKRLKVPVNRFPMLSAISTPLFRHMKKRPGFYAVNILGLVLGLTVVFLSSQWITYHKSYDSYHDQKERIYQVMTNQEGASGEISTSYGGVLRVMEDAALNIADIDQMTHIISNWRWPSEQCFKVDQNKSCIYSKGMYADKNFFEIFNFKIIAGDPNPLSQPKQIYLTF